MTENSVGNLLSDEDYGKFYQLMAKAGSNKRLAVVNVHPMKKTH